jgi:ribose transport system substrate-binding protein
MKINKTVVLAVAGALALTTALSACSSSDDSASSSGEGKNITLILGVNGDDFYKAIECGAKIAANEAGAILTVQAGASWDAGVQVPIVNAVAATNPDAIIIAPNDDTALFPPLKAAVDGGAKLVLVDTNLKDGSISSGHIGSDYVLYGQQGAAELAKLVGDKGTVLGIFAPPGVSTNDFGRQGFTEEMKKHPNIKVLPFQYSTGEAGKSAAIVAATLAAHKDLAGVFTFNGGDAQGIVTALREAKAADKVSFVSGDAQPFQVEQLKAGQVKTLVVQQARQMGKLAVQYALNAIAGKTNPAETALPTVVGNMANLETPEVADNLYKGCEG